MQSLKKSLIALSLAAALPFAAHAAEGVSYDYVEGGYVRTDIDVDDGVGNAETDGWSIGGSAAVADNFHLFGNYQDQQIEGLDWDLYQFNAGVGYNHEISPKADLVTRVGYLRTGLDTASGNVHMSGYNVEAGVRGAFTPNFEAYAMAGYEDPDRFSNISLARATHGFYGRVGAQVKFSPRWGLTGDVKFADGDTQLFLGPRLSF